MLRGIAGKRWPIRAIPRVNIDASIEQQRHNRSRAADNGAMQERAAGAIAPFEQRGIRIQHHADAANAPRLRRQVDRMLGVSIVISHMAWLESSGSA
jgi:hypothetical protein